MPSTTNLASSLHLRNLFELWFLLLSIHLEPAAVTKLIIHHSPCCFCAKLRFLCIKTTGPRPPCGKHHQEYQTMPTTAMGMLLPLLSCHHQVRAEYQCTQVRDSHWICPKIQWRRFWLDTLISRLATSSCTVPFCNWTTILFPFQKYS